MISNICNIHVNFPLCTMHKNHILISSMFSSKERVFWRFESVLKHDWQRMIKILSLQSISALADFCMCKQYSTLFVVRVVIPPPTPSPSLLNLYFRLCHTLVVRHGFFFGFKVIQHGNWTQLRGRLFSIGLSVNAPVFNIIFILMTAMLIIHCTQKNMFYPDYNNLN